MSELISRRSAIGAAALGAAALAAASLSGCSSEPEAKEWDGSSYLPMGTVVKMKDDASGMQLVVMGRRPKTSKVFSKDDDGTVGRTASSEIYDYALLPWPAGVLYDFAKIQNEITGLLVNSDKIGEVVFFGYEDDTEKEAEELLASAKESNISGPTALEGMYTEIASKTNGVAQ